MLKTVFLGSMLWLLPLFSQAAGLALTLPQTLDWQPSPDTEQHISTVPLANRTVPLAGQLFAGQDRQFKLLVAPDGMDNLALDSPGKQFNHYVITNWAYIDVLNWFAGSADNTVNIPAANWVATAHRNGVKVIGSVFLAPTAWGGNASTVQQLVQQDAQGRFPVADKLVAMAQHYGFDGWLINQETSVSALPAAEARALSEKMQAFMQYLLSIRPDTMEIHWYDAMLSSGEVRWQNQLNSKLAEMIMPQGKLFADAIFLNYFWRGAEPGQSQQYALTQGIDPYAIYTGADLWPGRREQAAFRQQHWLQALFDSSGRKAFSSLALFGNNFNFSFNGDQQTPAFSTFARDSSDVQSFYRAEQRLFSGDNLNKAHLAVAGEWPGLAQFMPARTVVTQLPFTTHFNTGHGQRYARAGVLEHGDWHDIRQQDILPSWQFAVHGNPTVQLQYDFSQPYQGGSSLAISADLRQGTADIPLYLTGLTLASDSSLTIVAQQSGVAVLQLWLELDGKKQFFTLPVSEQWQQQQFSLAEFAGRQLSRIGITVAAADQRQYQALLGAIKVE